MQEAGGVQDQIFASFGNLSTIEVKSNGDFSVKPVPITQEFKEEFEHSLILIYTNEQRTNNEVAKSYEKDLQHKLHIKEIAHATYGALISENIKSVGNLVYESWLSKIGISSLITNDNINSMVNDVMSLGAYGCKILGSGGCGFLMVIAATPLLKFPLIANPLSFILVIFKPKA